MDARQEASVRRICVVSDRRDPGGRNRRCARDQRRHAKLAFSRMLTASIHHRRPLRAGGGPKRNLAALGMKETEKGLTTSITCQRGRVRPSCRRPGSCPSATHEQSELLGEPPPLTVIVTRDVRVRENAEALGYAVEEARQEGALELLGLQLVIRNWSWDSVTCARKPGNGRPSKLLQSHCRVRGGYAQADASLTACARLLDKQGCLTLTEACSSDSLRRHGAGTGETRRRPTP
jgi:hypothetical protein